MTETLSFPGLGLEFDINRVAFSVFGLPIYWYGILIAAAFLLGMLYVLRRVKTFGLDGDRLMDVLFGGVLLGIVGARLYFVLFSWDSYKDNLLSIFNIRSGGLAIYGAIIGAVLAAVVICRMRRVRLLPALDVAVGGLLLGQAIGRWGNFVNIEAFGSNTSLPWGMHSDSIKYYLAANQSRLAAIGVTVDPQMPVHPTFLYESLWCLLGFLFIAWYTKRRRFDGELTLIYLGWYGFGRVFIEGLRTDPLLIGTVRVSQIVALLCVLASVILLLVIHSRIRRANAPDFMPLYVNTEEGQSVLAGTFYKKKPANRAKDAVEAEVAETGEKAERELPVERAEDNNANANPQTGNISPESKEDSEAQKNEEDKANGADS